jgi:phosphoketolase
VVYLLEPGRFRWPRTAAERAHQAPAAVGETLFPPAIRRRVLITHTRPEPMLGLLEPFRTAPLTSGLGYVNEGGTYDTPGLLFVNRSSWAHGVAEVARLLDLERERLLGVAELEALDGRISPHGLIIPAIAPDGDAP